ncbi:hypothetical protein T11_1678 [Trichinella zimbabwensis]|uniref:Uncharacterized protein n=1 Tax=Trichinella zimbabwensis TaxID=268475 RepID=A0A0V1I459_9BILA|nr:hypothetical protein T11_1678 [Trichinella zimbabwensis]
MPKGKIEKNQPNTTTTTSKHTQTNTRMLWRKRISSRARRFNPFSSIASNNERKMIVGKAQLLAARVEAKRVEKECIVVVVVQNPKIIYS